ncbi:MAG TPA: hypothetical protein VGF77_17205 [Allosphingosinicella sp.]
MAILLALLVLFGLYLALVPDGSVDSTSDPATRVLGLIALAWGIGGALAAAVLLDPAKARYGVAAGVGIGAALLYNSAPVRPITGNLLADLLLAAAIGAIVAGLATWFSVSWTWGFDGPAIRRWLQQLLLPRNWPQGPKPGQLSSKQLVTRWFVTIAASTGSVVGALAAQPRFWNAAAEALSPKRILFTLLLMVVSITLIGPLEEYIFGRPLARPGATPHEAVHGGARSLIEDLWENFSPHAAGRLALVFLFSLQPTLLDACVREAIIHSDAQASFVVLTSAIGPAFTTYYWSAALQGKTGSISRQAGKSTTYFSAILAFPVTALLCLALAARLSMAWFDGHVFPAILILAMIGLALSGLLAIAIGFVLDGISGYAGGWALDRARDRRNLEPWQAVGLLGGVLVVSKLIVLIITIALLGSMVHTGSLGWRENLLPATISMIGWTGGLLVSGFPQILHGARATSTGPSPKA